MDSIKEEFEKFHNGLERYLVLQGMSVMLVKMPWYKRRWIRELVFGLGIVGLMATQAVCQDIDWKFVKTEEAKPLLPNKKEARKKAVEENEAMIGWHKIDPTKHKKISELKAVHYKEEVGPGFPCLIISGPKGVEYIVREENIGEDATDKIKAKWGVPDKEAAPGSGIAEDLARIKRGTPESPVRPTFCISGMAERVQMAKSIGKPIMYYVDVTPRSHPEVEKFFLEFSDAENVLISDAESETGHGQGPRVIFKGKDQYHYYMLAEKIVKDGKHVAAKVKEHWEGWTVPPTIKE